MHNAPAASAAALPVLKECAPGCTLRGTCNRELGRCDCPPFYTGADCSEPLFPACVDQWGLKPPVAPCGIHTQPAFPATCACVAQCHTLSLDARQECVIENNPGESLANTLSALKSREGVVRHPTMNWMPVIANATWLERTRADARRSAEEQLCSGHGILSVQLPYEFYPKEKDCQPGLRQWGLEECFNQREPRCRCFPGWTGKNCETDMSKSAAHHKCFNDCSGRGECVHNFCKCVQGTWGADCSLGSDAEQLLAARAAADPARGPAEGGVRPLIYVYELPPRFNSWIAAFRRGDWTRDHWYGVDVILHQKLLRSKYRTLDPEQADFFFIPLQLSLGYYSHRYYFKHFTQPAHQPLKDAIAYVKATWPQHWARKGGRDHLIVMSQDQGNRYVRRQVPEAKPLLMLHHWGAPGSVLVDKDGQGDHIPGHDLCVPPFHGEQFKLNRWVARGLNSDHGGCTAGKGGKRGEGDPTACARPALERQQLSRAASDSDFERELFFSGKMNLNWGRHYSLGVRQAIFRAHRNVSRFMVMTFDNGVQEKIPLEQHVHNYATSKFCLAPAGYGFSSRQYEAVLVGCVPLIIQDDVEMAFEGGLLPWNRFSLRLNFSDIPILPQLLSRIPPAHVARLRRGLGCVWPRMLWLTEGLYPKEVNEDTGVRAARPYDAFETTMWALRHRLGLAHDGEATGDWRTPLASCVREAGDGDSALDLDVLRAEVRAELAAGRSAMNKDAAEVAKIIEEWQATADDKTFAMKTRFFPSGVKVPGLKWTP